MDSSYTLYSVTVCPANVSAKVVEAPVYVCRETECCCTFLDCFSDLLCSPSFLSAELSGRLDVLLRRLKRFGYIQNIFRYQDLLDKADKDLFSNMCSSQHCLHHLLPPLRSVDNLRERGHSFILPDYNTKTDKKSFVLHSLSNYLIKSSVHWTWFLSCSRSSFISVLCVILY